MRPSRFAGCWGDVMRQHRRFRFLHLSRIRVTNRLSNEPMGVIGDISFGGLRLVTKEPLAVGGCYEIRLQVPEREGRVREVDIAVICQWIRRVPLRKSFNVGLALDRPSSEFVDLVSRLLAKR